MDKLSQLHQMMMPEANNDSPITPFGYVGNVSYPGTNPFAVNPYYGGLDLWFSRLGIDFDDPNRLEYVKMFAQPYEPAPWECGECMSRDAYDHNGLLDLRGWAVSHHIDLDDPLLLAKFAASGDHVQSEMSQAFIEGAMDYARMEAEFDRSGGVVPMSAEDVARIEDMHLNALQRAADAAASGYHGTASQLRDHARDLDNLLHGNNGNW